MVNIVWVQMSQIVGKGLTYWEIFKFLFYSSATVVSMVLPLTILLSSIMTFGDFGERYELAAMKAAGISLTRVMMPLFIVTMVLSLILVLFQNNINPAFQRKARNMMYNIALTKPALNFVPGQFVNTLPGFSIKFDKIEGDNGERIEGVFLHKATNVYDDQQSIIAKKGLFSDSQNKNYLKLTLFDGYIYEDNLKNKSYQDRFKQQNQSIKFDTMVYHFDISEITKKAIEKEQLGDDYRFQRYDEIEETVITKKKENTETFKSLSASLVNSTNSYVTYIDSRKFDKKVQPQYKLDTLKKDKKLEILYNAYNKIEVLKSDQKAKEDEIGRNIKSHSKMIIFQQRIFSYGFTCIIFFLIGASLGSIIRKGGMGLPVVIAIIIFIIYFVMNLGIENISWKGKLDPYLAAWLPNMILFPFGVWLTYKAMTDSQVFDGEKYKKFFKPVINLFQKNKEHSRYR